MNHLPWQAVAILFFIVGAVAMFGILTWFYFNVKDDLDNVSQADGDTEPPSVRAQNDKTPDSGGNTSEG